MVAEQGERDFYVAGPREKGEGLRRCSSFDQVTKPMTSEMLSTTTAPHGSGCNVPRDGRMISTPATVSGGGFVAK